MFFLFAALAAKPTHQVGGELYYVYLGNNLYEIHLKLYRDCGPGNVNGTPFDPGSLIGIYQGKNLYRKIELINGQLTKLPVTSLSACLSVPPNLCIEEAYFKGVVELPPSKDDYTLAYQRCCRSPLITNLSQPDDYGISMYVTVPGTDKIGQGANSSAYFKNSVPLLFCINEDVVFDQSAVDPDGDSLVYGLIAPYAGGSTTAVVPDPPAPPPYSRVPWYPGFSDNYPIDSDPAIKIDRLTGQLTLKPTKQGIYVFGVYVEEYRNGVLLSTNVRDYQFTVANCSYGVSSEIARQSKFCQGLTMSFGLQNPQVKYATWLFGDLENPLGTASGLQPSFTFPDTGFYEIYVITNPGLSCCDTSTMTVEVRPSLDLKVDSQTVQCILSNNFNFGVTGNFAKNAWVQWTFSSEASISQSDKFQVNGVTFNQAGTFQYMVIIHDNRCRDSLISTVQVDPVNITADFSDQDVFCKGTLYEFENQSLNTETFIWDFGFPGGTSSDASPAINFPDTGTYQVTLIAGKVAPCTDTITRSVVLQPDFAVWFDLPDTLCFNGHTVDLALEGIALPPSPLISWTFPGAHPSWSANKALLEDVSFGVPGQKTFAVTVKAYNCERSYEDSLVLMPNPAPDFAMSAISGCEPLEVKFENQSKGGLDVSFEWNLGNKTDTGQAGPSTVYMGGIYTPELTMISHSGCRDTALYSGPLIHVYGLPEIGFYFEENSTFIDDPRMVAVSTLADNSLMRFLLNDSIQCNISVFDYTYFKDVGTYRVTQENSNGQGCISRMTRNFEVLGYFFYAPNAFTPDGDGYNDQFLPSVSTCQEYRLTIFDRWGLELFTSTDRMKAWNGEGYEEGIYYYVANMITVSGERKKFSGAVTLIR